MDTRGNAGQGAGDNSHPGSFSSRNSRGTAAAAKGTGSGTGSFAQRGSRKRGKSSKRRLRAQPSLGDLLHASTERYGNEGVEEEGENAEPVKRSVTARVTAALRKVSGSDAEARTETKMPPRHFLTLAFCDPLLDNVFVEHYNHFVQFKIRSTIKYGLIAEMLFASVVNAASLWDHDPSTRQRLLLARLGLAASMTTLYRISQSRSFEPHTQLITALFFIVRGVCLATAHAIMLSSVGPADTLSARSVLSFSSPQAAFVAFDTVWFLCLAFNFSGLRFVAATVVAFVVSGAILAVVALWSAPDTLLIAQVAITMFALCAYSAFVNEERVQREFVMRRRIEQHQEHADGVLLRMLPAHITKQLRQGISIQSLRADFFDEVSIMFSYITDFEALVFNQPPEKIIHMLDDVFGFFDQLTQEGSGVEKIEAGGSEYLAATGCPYPDAHHARNMCRFALALLAEVEQQPEFTLDDGSKVRFKVGINSGHVVGGVIGMATPLFKLFGDTMNTASRMCKYSEEGRVNVTAKTAMLLQQYPEFELEERPIIEVKGKGKMKMFWASRVPAAQESSTAPGERDAKGQMVHESVPAATGSFDGQNGSDKPGSLVRVQELHEMAVLRNPGPSTSGVSTPSEPANVLTLRYKNPVTERAFMRLFDDSSRQPVTVLVLGAVILSLASVLVRTQVYDLTRFLTATHVAVIPSVIVIVAALWACAALCTKCRQGFHTMQIVFAPCLCAALYAFYWSVETCVPGVYNDGYPIALLLSLAYLAFVFRLQTMWVITYCSVWLVASLIVLGVQAPSASLFAVHAVYCCVCTAVFLYASYMKEKGVRDTYLLRGRLYQENLRLEKILASSFPLPIAQSLMNGEVMEPDNLGSITMVFADIKGFTPLSASMSPSRLCQMLNVIYSAFDRLTLRHNIFKLDTVGDCFVAAAGIPGTTNNHAQAVTLFAIEALRALRKLKANYKQLSKVELRVGVHSGSAVGGVVGSEKLRYLIWGKTAIVANNMESSGTPGRVQVSQDTWKLIEEAGYGDKFQRDKEQKVQVADAEVVGYLVRKRTQRNRGRRQGPPAATAGDVHPPPGAAEEKR